MRIALVSVLALFTLSVGVAMAAPENEYLVVRRLPNGFYDGRC